MKRHRLWILIVCISAFCVFGAQAADSRGGKLQESNSTPTATAGSNPEESNSPTLSLMLTATPNPDGSVVHTVLPGQTLISIAEAYEISLSALLAQNGLTLEAVIVPDQALVILFAPTPTDTIEPSQTATEAPPTPTLRPTRTPTKNPPTPSPAAVASSGEEPTAPNPPQTRPEANASNSEDWVGNALLIAIVALAAVGALLVLVGSLLRRSG